MMYDMVTKGQKKEFGHRVIQRRKVNTACLNVIGENHLGERNSEIVYLDSIYNHLKYNYWTESTFPFKTTPFNMEGDPQYLRFQYWVKAVEETTNELLQELCTIQVPNQPMLQKVRYLEYVMNEEILSTQMDNNQGTLSRFVQSKVTGSFDSLKDLICKTVKRIKEHLALLEWKISKKTINMKEVKPEIDTILDDCKTLVTELGIGFTKENYRHARSTGMDEAANQYYMETGVWKIGDSHRNDMEDFPDRKYNLIGMEEFQNMVHSKKTYK